MNVLDLFSGIGGFSLGLERAGMQTVAFCEIEPYCRAVLAKHWPGVPIFEDVRKLKAADITKPVDVICGGYPCQPFSVAGKRLGTADDRHLWPEYFRLVQELRPTWVCGENVAGHISMGLDAVLSDLEALGYSCRTFVIPACAVGAKHRRDRCWIVAHASGQRLQGGRPGPEFGNQAGNVSRREAGGVLVTDAADAISGEQSFGGQVGRMGRKEPISWHGLGEITSQPFVRRGTHGIPNRAHRLRSLGNAVVPQIPEMIGRAIMEVSHATA